MRATRRRTPPRSESHVLIGLQVAGSPLTSIIDELQRFPGILHVHKVFGDRSLRREVCSTSVGSLNDLMQDMIVKVPRVRRMYVDGLIQDIPVNVNAMSDLALPMIKRVFPLWQTQNLNHRRDVLPDHGTETRSQDLH
jgi:DNA-binding Lrp family transcriptional regulator